MISIFQSLTFLFGKKAKKSQHFQDCLRKEMDSGAQVSVLTGLPGALGPWRFRVIGWPVGISITSPGDGVPSRSVFKHICLPLHGILTILLQVSYQHYRLILIVIRSFSLDETAMEIPSGYNFFLVSLSVNIFLFLLFALMTDTNAIHFATEMQLNSPFLPTKISTEIL